MVQDRLKIMKGGGTDVVLSRQTFLCAPHHLVTCTILFVHLHFTLP